MQRILTAILLIAAVVLILFEAPLWVVTLAAALVAGLALFEYVGLANKRGASIPVWFILPAAALLFLLPTPQHLTVITILAIALLGWASFSAPAEQVLPDAAYGIFGLLWVVYPLVLLPQMSLTRGPALVLFLFVVVWSGDIAALYIGKNFGRHKLAPRLSPNKTWEGSIASVAGSVLCGMALVFAGNELNIHTGSTILSIDCSPGQLALLAVLLNIAAQIGDLVESAVKRGSGVKDSGAMLPGHGGMLDRIDALLLAAPVLWYALEIKEYFRF
jgi:phosphatidate cytidylyltransferase